MSMSIFSLIMAVLWFDAFIFISSGLRRKTGFLLQYSLLPLISLLILSLVRLLIPFELPFATVLRSYRFLPFLQNYWNHSFSLWGGLQLSVALVLVLISTTVSVILLIHFFVRMQRGNAYIRTLYTEEDARARHILQDIIDQTKPGQDCTLRIAPGIASPIVTGFFHLLILIPESTKVLSDKQMEYILRHEWNHYLSKDLWVKLLIQILCCIMWWNPPVYLLKRDLDQILELNCDHGVTRKMKEKERLEYLETMIEILKHYYGKENRMLEAGVGVNFVGIGKGANTIQRFQLVYDHQKRIANWKTNLIFVLIMGMLFLVSFSFVFQPYSMPPIEEGSADYFMITPENAHLEVKEGIYSLYVNGKCIDASVSRDMLQMEPFNILPIMNEEE